MGVVEVEDRPTARVAQDLRRHEVALAEREVGVLRHRAAEAVDERRDLPTRGRHEDADLVGRGRRDGEPVGVAAHRDAADVELVHRSVDAAEPMQCVAPIELPGGEKLGQRAPRELGEVEQPSPSVEPDGRRHAERVHVAPHDGAPGAEQGAGRAAGCCGVVSSWRSREAADRPPARGRTSRAAAGCSAGRAGGRARRAMSALRPARSASPSPARPGTRPLAPAGCGGPSAAFGRRSRSRPSDRRAAPTSSTGSARPHPPTCGAVAPRPAHSTRSPTGCRGRWRSARGGA